MATGAKTSDNATAQSAHQSADTTSPASSSPNATTPTDQIFTATAGGNLIQAAATGGNLIQPDTLKASGAGEKQSPAVSLAALARGISKAGAASIADKVSKLLAAATPSDAATTAKDQTQAPVSSTTSPNTSVNGNAANTAASGATDVAGIIAAVEAALSGSKFQQTTVSDTVGTTASLSAKDSKGDNSDSQQSNDTSASATATAQVQQPVVQPIAAAIPATSQINAPPASGNTAVDVQVGDTAKSGAKFAMAVTSGKDSMAAQTSTDPESAKQPLAAGNPELKAGKPFNANNSSKAQAPDPSGAQSSQSTADNSAPAQLPGNVPSATSELPSPHAETFAAAVTSDGAALPGSQTALTSAKADATGLPNFGISAGNASAPSTATAASATTNAPNTVPVAGLAVAIASRVQAGSSQFDIRLEPAELGRIEVRLNVDRDGRVTSHVTVDRADTLQLLQDQQPQLQQALDQAGLKTADNGLQFTLRDQSFAGQQNNGGNGTQQNTSQLVIPDADLPTVQSAQIYNRLNSGTGVDIRV